MTTLMSQQEFIEQRVSGYQVWARNAPMSDVAVPDAERIATGFKVERPSHRIFNWLFRRTDEYVAALEARVAYLEYYLGVGIGGAGAVKPPDIKSPSEGAAVPAAADITVITSPAAVVGAANATHASTDWKLTSDPEGVFAIALDEASPDLVTHTFTGLNLAAGQTYYVWARHNATPVGYGPWARAAVYVS